jgi:hypothetical protein
MYNQGSCAGYAWVTVPGKDIEECKHLASRGDARIIHDRTAWKMTLFNVCSRMLADINSRNTSTPPVHQTATTTITIILDWIAMEVEQRGNDIRHGDRDRHSWIKTNELRSQELMKKKILVSGSSDFVVEYLMNPNKS